MQRVILYTFLILSSGVLSGCGSSRAISAERPVMIGEYNEDKKMESDGYAYDQGQKIIFSAYLHMTVRQPDTANVQIGSIAKKYDGYVNEIGTHMTTIRVKSNYLEEAINDITALGKLREKNLVGEDVTDAYYDHKIRLENAERARARYLELLTKAEDVKAALLVEKELERLNGEIDFLKGQMKRINHLSEFSTITIFLKEKKKLGILGYIGKGVYEGVKWLFVRN